MSIDDGSAVWPPMEELADAEGLLGGWGAEGGEAQSRVGDSVPNTSPHSQSTPINQIRQ